MIFDIYLSFHEILTWQIPADIELVNMSTQKNIITAQQKTAMSINSQTTCVVLIVNNKTKQ
jgi:hypothetical protein